MEEILKEKNTYHLQNVFDESPGIIDVLFSLRHDEKAVLVGTCGGNVETVRYLDTQEDLSSGKYARTTANETIVADTTTVALKLKTSSGTTHNQMTSNMSISSEASTQMSTVKKSHISSGASTPHFTASIDRTTNMEVGMDTTRTETNEVTRHQLSLTSTDEATSIFKSSAPRLTDGTIRTSTKSETRLSTPKGEGSMLVDETPSNIMFEASTPHYTASIDRATNIEVDMDTTQTQTPDVTSQLSTNHLSATNKEVSTKSAVTTGISKTSISDTKAEAARKAYTSNGVSDTQTEAARKAYTSNGVSDHQTEATRKAYTSNGVSDTQTEAARKAYTSNGVSDTQTEAARKAFTSNGVSDTETEATRKAYKSYGVSDPQTEATREAHTSNGVSDTETEATREAYKSYGVSDTNTEATREADTSYGVSDTQIEATREAYTSNGVSDPQTEASREAYTSNGVSEHQTEASREAYTSYGVSDTNTEATREAYTSKGLSVTQQTKIIRRVFNTKFISETTTSTTSNSSEVDQKKRLELTSTAEGIKNETCIQKCNCLSFINLRPEEILQMVENLVKELKIDKKETTLAKNKKISAADERPSSQAIGLLGILMLCSSIGIIILSDIETFVRFIKITFCSKRRKLN
ncbi:uncharacterized protein LOC127708258 [Mytilus californianus]|uniref:uncharacterized protein LOC127708258 n=1 Tax=Mytilus californianus TaxID=6549 RepID=UPI0022454CEC|nr:uncharacterized protein LOC127708258 [Mytilus californianus]